jgi:hypothetical protein
MAKSNNIVTNKQIKHKESGKQ